MRTNHTFAREVLSRLPLAESVLHLWHHVCNPDSLQRIFEQHRGACYDRILTFPVLVQLVGDALLEHQGSGRQSFQRGQETGELQTSLPAAYQKLGRLPLAVSEAFLAEASDQLAAVLPLAAANEAIPASLRDFAVVILDGKAIKHVHKRLAPLRKCSGGVLGGKALVALDLDKRLVLAMATAAEGDTNEAKLVPKLLPGVQALRDNLLWIGDRQFGDPTQMRALCQRPGDHCVLRYHPKTTFFADPTRPAQSGVDSRGRHYEQEWGWLGAVRNQKRCYVRRITLYRPGEEDVILITDLLDEERYPAVDLLEVYLHRWDSERVFLEITEVFSLKELIGTTPQGTIFQLAFCLLLYNMIQVVRAHVAQGAGRAVPTVSTELLFVDVRRQLISLHATLTAGEIVEAFAPVVGFRQVQARLQKLLGGVWTERWRKAPPKKRKAPENKDRKREHKSAYRVIQEYRLAKKRDKLSIK